MGLQKKKLVFLDIDGTLLPRNRKISEKVIQALCRAHDNGHILCICTGRTYSSIPDGIKRFDGVISGAGSCIMWKNEILLAEYFSEEEMRRVAGLLEETKAIYTMEGFDNLYMKKDIYDDFLKRLEDCSDEEREILRYFERTTFCDDIAKMKKVHKLSYFYAGKDSGWFRERLKKWDMNVATFSQGDERGNSGEITKTAFTKGFALRYFAKYLDIPIEDTIAIGDSENDLSMLTAAGVGIAMGNAGDAVKKAADDVTESIENDGVYYAFKKYGLLA